jgi:hypothetical protein
MLFPLSKHERNRVTLIITELSHFGIAMAADTAETVNSRNVRGLIEDRAFFGLTKLMPIQKLQAGISYWGWAKMPPFSEGGVWMDWWLRAFLAKNINSYDTISDLAGLLEKELRKIVPPLSETELELMPHGDGGIHLAGFVDEDEKKVPSFWHIHNGLSQALPEKKLDPHIVNANFDCPPSKFLQIQKSGATYVTTNGDIEAWARFFRRYFKEYLDELRKEMKIVIPLPTIDFRAEFWRAQIRFISEVYGMGGIIKEGTIHQMARGIGGEVTTLTITEEGIHNYQTR